MSLRPWYNKDANYQTNAKSFMDYLARTNKFIEVLIEDYEIFQELVIEELERIKFDAEMAVDDILLNWLEDGTLARIINDGVLGNKADTSYVDSELQKIEEDMLEYRQTLTDDVTNQISGVKKQINDLFVLITPDLTTQEIQDLLDQKGTFKFTTGEYNLSLNEGIGLDIKSDTILIFDEGVNINIPSTSLEDYRILNIEKRENIRIYGGKVYGDKYSHSGSGGEWGHGLSIRGSKNVYVEGFKAFQCWGDGIYIGQSSDYSVDYCENIHLQDILCKDNRRQGISVTGVTGLYINGIRLEDTGGTPPSAGIDFEPNNNRNKMENIVIDGIYTKNNAIGLEFHLHQLVGWTDQHVDITINGHVSEGDNYGISMRNSTKSGKLTGRVVINEPVLKDNRQGIVLNWVSETDKDIHVIIKHPKIIRPNVHGSTTNSSGAAIRMMNHDESKVIGNLTITELEIILDGHTIPLPISLENPKVNNFNIIDPMNLGGFYSFRALYGQYTITDKFRILISDTAAIETNVHFNFAKEYRNTLQPNYKNIILHPDHKKGMEPIKITATNPTGTIVIQPDVNSSIEPFTGTGENLNLSYGEYVVLERMDDTTWFVVETNKVRSV